MKNATFKRKKDGSVKVKLAGKRAELELPAEGPVFVLVGFRDETAGSSSNMCASTVESFREKKPGKLVLP